MRQVVQAVSGGPVRVIDVPSPVVSTTQVLVHTRATVISAGTERAMTSLARASLVEKARARPDLVRQVIRKAANDGLRSTVEVVRTRLAGDLPLGYSGAGVAVEVGEHVVGVRPGQLVATGGAGYANHAELQAVPGLLCTPVPDRVSAEDAAFATLASVALHALRLAEAQPGGKVVIVGLGLIGQVAARLAQGGGADVAGVDVADFPIVTASASGVLAMPDGDDVQGAIMDWSRGRGADAVVVTAADPSSTALRRVPGLCRDRAVVVVVGDTGLDLQRSAFYEKELTLRVARSYGPGRYEMSYEQWGVDLPIGSERWSEGRNQEAIVDLLNSGRLKVDDLVTHRFGIDEAPRAYELIERRREPYLAVQLSYSDPAPDRGPIRLRSAQHRDGGLGVGLIGAGNFAQAVLLPALSSAGFTELVAVASATGVSAAAVANAHGFEKVADPDTVLADEAVRVVVVATEHSSHAELVAKALRAGKSVWCEKPLALDAEELETVEHAWREGGGVLFVGFNRRFAPAIERVKAHMEGSRGPLVVTYRVNAGSVPKNHWYADRRAGGRLLGEVCHFVDTAAALAGPVEDLTAMGSSVGELLLSPDFAVMARHGGGSLSTVSYAAGGPPSLAKERIEVVGRGRSAVVQDFSGVELDGRPVRLEGRDKGHKAMARAFRRAVLEGDPCASIGLDASAWVLKAAATLGGTGGRASPPG